MAVSTSTANDLMVVFSDTVTHGFTALAGPVNAVLGTLIVLVVGLTGIQWALSPNREILASAMGKLLLIGAFAWLVNDWQHLSEVVFSGFLQLGLTAGRGGVSQADFFNPGAVLEEGWTLVKAMGAIQTHGSGPLDVAGNITDALILAVAMIGVMLAFAVLALQIIVTLLEFKIVTLGGFVLLPFGVWTKSAFLAERPLGYVVSAGLKVLALAIVISGAKAVFDRLIPSADPDIYEALSILVASILLALLAFFIPNIASALVTGGPSLGAGSALTAGLAVGGAAALGSSAIAGAGAAAGGASSSAGGTFARGSRAAAGATQGRGSSPPPSASPPSPGGSGSGGSSKTKSPSAAANDDRGATSNGGPAEETGGTKAGAIVGRANLKAASRQGAPSPSAPTGTNASPVSKTADATSAAAPASPQTPTGSTTPSAAATPQVAGQPAASDRDVQSAVLDASAASSAAHDASAPLSETAQASASGQSGTSSSAPRHQGRRTPYSPHAASLRAKRSAEASAHTPQPLDPTPASPPSSAAAEPVNDDAARGAAASDAAAAAPTPGATPAAAPRSEAHREPSGGKAPKARGQPRAPARRSFQLYWAANAGRQLLPANETTGAVHPDLKREEA